MQHTGTKAGATHAAIGDAQHVTHALRQQLLGDGELPPLRHAGAAQGTGVLQNQHAGGIHIQIRIINARAELGITRKDNGTPCVLMQVRLGSRRFDHRAIRTQIAFQDSQTASGQQGLVHRQNHVVVEYCCTRNVVTQCQAIDGGCMGVQFVPQALQQRTQATGAIKIFHQIFTRRTQIGNERRGGGQLIKTVQRQLHTRAPCHRYQMHQRVGGAPQRQHGGHRVVKRLSGQYLCGANVLPDHLHDALTGLNCHLCVP